jgi:hypothetical protein
MITFLSGMGAMLGLMLMLGAGYILGQRNTPRNRPSSTEQEEEKRKRKELDRQFNNLMSYDDRKAYERKVK